MSSARPARRPGRLRRLVAAVLAAATAAALLTAGAPAQADPASPPVGAGAVQAANPFLTTEPATVTLVTGDRVTVTPVADSYRIDPVPSGDGRDEQIVTQASPDGVFAIPLDAMPAINSGFLDKDLFNLDYLVNNGYTDAEMDTLPVIVQYPENRVGAQVARAARALPASEPVFTLESAQASAVRVSKSDARAFWAAIRGPASSGVDVRSLGRGVAKVWLDRKVTGTLDTSVPMIGAPDAWASGLDGTGVTVAVLDTGIDAGHPDLAGKVTASQSFIPGEEVTDGHGHGTHVASTITGSGAGSGGQYVGVAPGVELLVGKVLNNAGRGTDSQVIEGMEWAAQNGADIISMSLGGGATDGTDPTSLAVNNLTAQHGALFVVAAGNAGAGGAETVGSPGAADAALTVAAVDKSDRLAGFSSRGPRVGDGALKPDIAAPGVGIVAARAAGTGMGSPVDDHYTSANGTSMATPHVAGAAAILAQQHPDWTPEQLKAALMSTSVDDGFTVYEQGAGRVDVARVTSQPVVATTPHVDYRRVTGEETEPMTRDVSYANHGGSPVTLDLSTSLRTATGTVVDGVVSTDSAVTVPAGGTATVTVTAQTNGLEFGRYTGAVVATAGGVRVTTPIGIVRQPPTFNLTVHTIGRDGAPLSPAAQWIYDVAGDGGEIGGHTLTHPGTVETRVPAGTYHVSQIPLWVDDDSRINQALLFDPEVAVTGDTEIVLDLRTASEVEITTPLPSELTAGWGAVNAYQRTAANGDRFASGLGQASWRRTWVNPTEEVTTGEFWFSTQHLLVRPELAMAVTGRDGFPLDIAHESHGPDGGERGYRHFPAGSNEFPLVDVGLGDPDDLTGKDLAGKLVLMHTVLEHGLFGPECGQNINRIEAVREAGAAGIVVFPGPDIPCQVPMRIFQDFLTGPLRPADLPRITVSTKQGLALRDRLATEPVTIEVVSTQISPYSYTFSPYEVGRIPESLHYDLSHHRLVAVDSTVRGSVPVGSGAETLAPLRYDQLLTPILLGHGSHVAMERREYLGPLDPDVLYQRTMLGDGFTEFSEVERFTEPGRVQQSWANTPLTPGAAWRSTDLDRLLTGNLVNPRIREWCAVCRQADLLAPLFVMTSVNNGLGRHFGSNPHPDAEDYWDFTFRLSRDGTDIPLTRAVALEVFRLPPEAGTYQLTADGPDTDVRWTFTSARPTETATRPNYKCLNTFIGLTDNHPCQADPVLFAGYDLGDTLNGNGQVAAGRPHRFTVTVGNQAMVTQPEIAEVKLWVSTDEGGQWTPARLRPNRDGTYTATAFYPQLADTSGTVSLRIDASDVDGNRIEQTSLRAFELYDPRRG